MYFYNWMCNWEQNKDHHMYFNRQCQKVESPQDCIRNRQKLVTLNLLCHCLRKTPVQRTADFHWLGKSKNVYLSISSYLYLCVSSSGLGWEIEICREDFFWSHRNCSQFIKNQNTLFEGRSLASSSTSYFPFPFFDDFKICSFNSFIIISSFSLASRSCLSSSWSSCLSASAWSNRCLSSASCKIEHILASFIWKCQLLPSRHHWYHHQTEVFQFTSIYQLTFYCHQEFCSYPTQC